MQEAFYVLNQTRQRFIDLINKFSKEKLNQIPEGWSNNLIWNFGHVIATQQLLCYKLGGVSMLVENEIIDKYRKGTKPDSFIDSSEISILKELALNTNKQIELDYNSQKFKEYQFYTTSFGVELRNIQEAILFNNTHEALHLGYAMSLRKALK